MTTSDWRFAAVLDFQPDQKYNTNDGRASNRIEMVMSPIGFTWRPGLPHMPTRHLNVDIVVYTIQSHMKERSEAKSFIKKGVLRVTDFWSKRLDV
jgi:hypothetical protein